MEQLLKDIVTRLTTQLPYLNWVGVVDDELLPPTTVEPPMVGVKDGGLLSPSTPGQKDREQLTIFVMAYQSLNLGEPGSAVVGSASQLGDAGKGLLAIQEDLQTALNDELFSHRFTFAHREALDPSRIITVESRLLSMLRARFLYRRIA